MLTIQDSTIAEIEQEVDEMLDNGELDYGLEEWSL